MASVVVNRTDALAVGATYDRELKQGCVYERHNRKVVQGILRLVDCRRMFLTFSICGWDFYPRVYCLFEPIANEFG